MQREVNPLQCCVVTNHVGLLGTKQQYFYTESECLYTLAVLRHAKVNRVTWLVVFWSLAWIDLDCWLTIKCNMIFFHYGTTTQSHSQHSINNVNCQSFIWFYYFQMINLHYQSNVQYNISKSNWKEASKATRILFFTWCTTVIGIMHYVTSCDLAFNISTQTRYITMLSSNI